MVNAGYGAPAERGTAEASFRVTWLLAGNEYEPVDPRFPGRE
jgi:hypothetical protein